MQSPVQTFDKAIEADKPVATRSMTLGLGGGVALEFYDWQLYGFMAAFLSPHFFPSTDPVVSLLAGLAVFGAGFAARPIGAALLGPIADRISHKTVMMIAVTAMAVSSMAIALLPGYKDWGIAATIILVTLRLVQGLAVGAEAGVANAIAIELAPPGQEGRYLGLINGTFIMVGSIGASAVAFLVSAAVAPEVLRDWGWRIPFGIGGVLGLLIIYLRQTLPETLIHNAMHRNDENERIQETTGGVWKALWANRLSLLAAILVVGGVQLANYTYNFGLPNIANGVFKENSTYVYGIVTLMGSLWMIFSPAIGALADKIKPSRAFVIMRFLLIPSFFLSMLYTSQNIVVFATVMMIGGTLVGLNMALYNFIATTLMPRNIRTTGVALAYAAGATIFGGTTPFLLLWLKRADMSWVFPFYGTVIALLSIVVYQMAKKRGGVYVGE